MLMRGRVYFTNLYADGGRGGAWPTRRQAEEAATWPSNIARVGLIKIRPKQ